MRFVSLSFIVFVLMMISACSPSRNVSPKNSQIWGAEVYPEPASSPTEGSQPTDITCRLCGDFPWLSIATPATVEFTEKYVEFLKLPDVDRKGFRQIAENELEIYNHLDEEMKIFENMRLNPHVYQGTARPNLTHLWEGFNPSLRALELATAMDPTLLDAWAAKGGLALQSGALYRARESLEIALFIAEDRAAAGFPIDLEERLEIHRHLGWTLRNLGYFDEGLIQIDRGLALSSNDHELTLLKGLLLAGAGRTSEAFTLAVRLPATEVRDYSHGQMGLSTKSNGYATLWIKSQALFAEGDYEGAMQIFKDINTNQVSMQRRVPFGEYYWNDVGLAAEMVQHEDAALFYEIAYYRLYQRFFCFTMSQPGGRLAFGFPDPHLPVFSTFGPRFYIAGSHLGFISFQMNSMAGGVFSRQRDDAAQRALNALDVAERRHIRPLICKALRGRIFHVQGRHAEAEAELTLAREGFATQGVVDERTSYLLGLLALNDDRNAEAQVLLEEAVKNGAGVVLYYRSLGLALAKQGKMREAEVVLDRAVVMDAYSVPGLFNLGLLYCKMRRFEEAVDVLEQANALDNESREVQHLLHLAKSSLRDKNEPREALKGPVSKENAGTSVAYVTRIMGELDALFTVADASGKYPGGEAGSAIASRSYEKNPTPFNRKVLALALMDEDNQEAVEELLDPFWGHDLDPDEVVFLLYANKQKKQKVRAQSLGRAILKGETGTDNPFIRVLALDSLDGPEKDGAQYALAHLAASPVLGVGMSSEPGSDGYWSNFMRTGFANYRAAVHSGVVGSESAGQMTDPWREDNSYME